MYFSINTEHFSRYKTGMVILKCRVNCANTPRKSHTTHTHTDQFQQKDKNEMHLTN